MACFRAVSPPLPGMAPLPGTVHPPSGAVHPQPGRDGRETMTTAD
ncbi:MAG TPA: hypothetical protein PLD25_25845 [Chloroflexota bacterium]|nr:hypothetical protein [Chloroflexota bacterium]HUM67806.1 hypothetical protein [Chloroflexota bacterium]